MPRTHNIDASEMFEPIIIKLWDPADPHGPNKPEFRLREAVRSVEKKVNDKQKEINSLAERAEPEEKELTELRRQLLDFREGSPLSPEVTALEKQIETKQEEILAKAATMEDSLPFLIEMLDILLEPKTPKTDPETGEQMMIPKETNKDGKPKAGTEMIPAFITASEAINQSLENDVIGITHIDALSRKLNETAMEARPT